MKPDKVAMLVLTTLNVVFALLVILFLLSGCATCVKSHQNSYIAPYCAVWGKKGCFIWTYHTEYITVCDQWR